MSDLSILRKRHASAIKTFAKENVVVEKAGNSWRTRFVVGNQSFDIAGPFDTKTEATFIQIMFCIALKRLML